MSNSGNDENDREIRSITTNREDNLHSIIFRAVQEAPWKSSSLFFSPQGQNYNGPVRIEIHAYSSDFFRKKIGSLEIKIHQELPIPPSAEFVKRALNMFGGREYATIGYDTGKTDNLILNPTYEINISRFIPFTQSNKVKMPAEITREEITTLTQLLDSLGVSYSRNEDSFQVKKSQFFNHVTLEGQCHAYQIVHEKGFPSRLSSKGDYRRLHLSDNHANRKFCTFERDNLKKERDVLHMQYFIEEWYGLQFGGIEWEVRCHGRAKKNVKKEKKKENYARIIEKQEEE